MDTFTEEHKTCLDFTIIFKAFPSSKTRKEMESEWFAFHFENQN